MNMFLHKIGLVTSSVCTVCKQQNESLEHLYINCFFSTFWQIFISFCSEEEMKLDALLDVDKFFGICENKTDLLLLNHLRADVCKYRPEVGEIQFLKKKKKKIL